VTCPPDECPYQAPDHPHGKVVNVGLCFADGSSRLVAVLSLYVSCPVFDTFQTGLIVVSSSWVQLPETQLEDTMSEQETELRVWPVGAMALVKPMLDLLGLAQIVDETCPMAEQGDLSHG